MSELDDRNNAYREAARQLVAGIPSSDVMGTGHVQNMKDGSGAFVEAIIWVPASALPCCTGINGSHTGLCPTITIDDPELVCWQCGQKFPKDWVASWSDKGSRHLDGNCPPQTFPPLAPLVDQPT